MQSDQGRWDAAIDLRQAASPSVQLVGASWMRRPLHTRAARSSYDPLRLALI